MFIDITSIMCHVGSYRIFFVSGLKSVVLSYFSLSSMKGSCDSVDLILFCRYVVDAADNDNLSISRSELHDLLSKPSLSGIPLLVLGNKIDKPGALSKQALTDQMWEDAIKYSFYTLLLLVLFYFKFKAQFMLDIHSSSWFCRGLQSITDREVCCFMISCKNSTNIDSVIDWLVKHSKSKSWGWISFPVLLS